jgi:hypothetical protein
VFSEWLIGIRLPTVIPNLLHFDLLVQGCHFSLIYFGSILLWKKKFYRRLGTNIAQWNLGIFHSVVYCMGTLIFLLFELQAFYCDWVDGSSLARCNGIESLWPTCEMSVCTLTASLRRPRPFVLWAAATPSHVAWPRWNGSAGRFDIHENPYLILLFTYLSKIKCMIRLLSYMGLVIHGKTLRLQGHRLSFTTRLIPLPWRVLSEHRRNENDASCESNVLLSVSSQYVVTHPAVTCIVHFTIQSSIQYCIIWVVKFLRWLATWIFCANKMVYPNLVSRDLQYIKDRASYEQYFHLVIYHSTYKLWFLLDGLLLLTSK